MSIFSAVTLKYEGKDYRIEPDKIMQAIAVVEEVITLHELMTYHGRGQLPLSKLSMAYGALLRYAGADATNEDVYKAMFGREGPLAGATAVTALLRLMLPPKQEAGQEAKLGKSASSDASSSSKRRMKRSSVGQAG